MGRYSVRLAGLKLKNFKNVVNGSLSFKNPRKDFKASILGLYGQNGSGKTSLIDALELLKIVLCGKSIPEKFYDYINVDSENAEFEFEFLLEQDGKEQTVFYSFELKKELEIPDQNIEIEESKGKAKICIVNEVFKCLILSKDSEGKLGRLIDTCDAETFGPKTKRKLFVSKGDETNLVVNRKLTYVQGRSFIFSPEMQSILQTRRASSELPSEEEREFEFYWSLINSLVYYGNFSLFIINTSNSGLISLNAQPFVFRYVENQFRSLGTIMLPLTEPVVISENEKDMVERIVKNMNIVLVTIIPGLTVSFKDLGTQVMENGEKGYRIQLMSSKNGKELPFIYESEGIKKIVSILQLLIVVYNQPSITVAIDELDSGVFEYLLGELVRIISEKGKGQLIFTSHNLRLLETLDRGFVAFTTTSPENRYIRLTKVKDSNNLRDLYYRDIILSEYHDNLYEETKNSEIAFAFREAGEYSGT